MGHRTQLKYIGEIVIILSVAFVFSSAKIIRHELQTVDEQNLAYYEALSQQERDAKVQLANLKKQIQFLHNTLDQVEDLPSMKTIALEEGLADERDILYTIQQDLTTPIKFKTVQCKNLTEEQAQSIGQAVDKIEKQTENLKVTINGLSNAEGCSLCQQMKRQYNWDILYLMELKAMLQPCPSLKPSQVDIALADLSKYNLVSNLNTDSRWVYGNTTQADYYMRIFNQNIGQNVSKCPIETPFIAEGQTQCSSCPQNKPIYDISLGKCVDCPENATYDQKTHKCLINGVDCGSKQFNVAKNQCECPSSRPHWDGKKCIACVLPEYFNKTTLFCEKCTDGKSYDVSLQKCAPKCEATHVYDEQNSQCICPSVAPFDDGVSCVACYLPKYWNLDKKVCEYCRDGLYYDVGQKKCNRCPAANPKSQGGRCHPCPEGSVYKAESNQCGNASHVCPSNYFYNKEKDVCECPEKTPFDTGSECVACYLPKYWSRDNKQCKSCPEATIYDIQRKVCTYCPSEKPVIIGYSCSKCPEGFIYDLGLQKCIQGQIKCPETQNYNSEKDSCDCQKHLPFFDGQKCVECYLPHFWDYDKKECSFCPQKTAYNLEKKACLPCPEQRPLYRDQACFACSQTQYYKKASGACYKAEDFCQSNYLFDEKQLSCVCSDQQPFDDGHKCNACKHPSYWNQQNLKCESCQTNFFFNAGSSKCEKCPLEYPIFSGLKCSKCPAGTRFEQLKNQCLSFNEFCRFEFPSRNFTYNEQSQKCQCPKQTPFDDGKSCVSCFLPKYWSHQVKKCLSCPANQYYNTNSLKCEHCPGQTPILSSDGVKCFACPQNSVFKIEKNACVSFDALCQQSYVYNKQKDVCQCPKDTPFDNGQKCVACYLPNYWSFEKSACLSCPKNYFYDTTIRKCVKCPIQTPILQQGQFKCSICPQNTAFDEKSQVCKALSEFCQLNYVYNVEKKSCECPKDLPFNNGQKCVACYLPKYWNNQKKDCGWCFENSVYNTNLKKCTACPENTPITDESKMKCVACPEKLIFDLDNNKCVSEDQYCESNKVYNSEKKSCECPKNAPFFSGSECVSCYLPKYWNHNTMSCDYCPLNAVYDKNLRRCVACPDETPITDESKLKCVACPENFVFDEPNSKCVNNQEFCGSNKVYNSVKKVCECPKTAPFFTGSQCVACYLPQYWNHDSRACEWCNKNYVYNTQTLRCEACPLESPVTDSTKTRCVVA